MTFRFSALIILALGVAMAATPVLAQSSNDAGGTGPVAGEGPGGSGAGQTSGGPQRLKMKMKKKMKHHHHAASK